MELQVIDSAGRVPAFVFASIMTSYPDEAFVQNLNALLQDPDLHQQLDGLDSAKWNVLREKLEQLLSNPKLIEDVRSDYIDLFDRGRQANPLYETEYSRNRTLVKSHDLVDIAGFYKAFGLETGQEGVQPEMVDHVSVELEFYSLLLMKYLYCLDSSDLQGQEIILDAQKKFLNSHLGRFVGAIAQRPGVSGNHFYSLIFETVKTLVKAECERLEVQPDLVSWTGEKEQTEEEIACGGLACQLPGAK